MKLPVIRIKESIEAYTVRAMAYLFGCGGLVILFGKQFKELGIYFRAVVFISIGAFLWAFIYNLRRALKERIALTLSEERFSYKKLHLSWGVIRSYQTYHKETEESSSDGMIITLKNDKRIKINIAMLDIDIMTLRRHMELFCAAMDIIDEGHIEMKVGES